MGVKLKVIIIWKSHLNSILIHWNEVCCNVSFYRLSSFINVNKNVAFEIAKNM